MQMYRNRFKHQAVSRSNMDSSDQKTKAQLLPKPIWLILTLGKT